VNATLPLNQSNITGHPAAFHLAGALRLPLPSTVQPPLLFPQNAN